MTMQAGQSLQLLLLLLLTPTLQRDMTSQLLQNNFQHNIFFPSKIQQPFSCNNLNSTLVNFKTIGQFTDSEFRPISNFTCWDHCFLKAFLIITECNPLFCSLTHPTLNRLVNFLTLSSSKYLSLHAIPFCSLGLSCVSKNQKCIFLGCSSSHKYSSWENCSCYSYIRYSMKEENTINQKHLK